MKYTIQIKRQNSSDESSYWQSFEYESDGSDSVASILRNLNNRIPLTDINGKECTPIEFDCGCLVRKCGACAMVINNKPGLACSTFLENLDSQTVKIEPLSKFPVVRDLKVDRSQLFDHLKDMEIWLEEKQDGIVDNNRTFQSSKCLMCGCCLEICPNYSGETNFYGALASVNASRIINQEKKSDHLKKVNKSYEKHYFNGCGKSLSCQNICPANIPIDELFAHSNAQSIWKTILKFGNKNHKN